MKPMTHETLEALGERAWAIFEPVLEAREGMPDDEWTGLGARTLATTSVRAEALGRSYGRQAVPVDGTALLPPDVTTTARRPAPADFEQRSGFAPAPDPVLDVAARFDKLSGHYAKSLTTLTATDRKRPAAKRDITARAERLVTDETISSLQRGYQDGIRVLDQHGEAYEDYGRDEGGRPLRDERGRQAPRSTSTTIRGYRRGVNPGCCELCFWLWKEGRVYDIDQPMHRHVGCRCVPVPTTDPVGRWALSAKETELLAALYDRYVTNKETTDD